MGLLDDIAGTVTGGGGKSGNAVLMEATGGMLGGGRGLQTVVDILSKNGLGDTISS